MKYQLIKILTSYNSLDVTFRWLKRILGVSKRKVNAELRSVLHELELEGKIYCDENEHYHKFPNNYVVSVIEQTRNNVAFVKVKDQKHMVRSENRNGALAGETVIVQRVPKSKTYKVVKILKRKNPKIICEVKLNENNVKYLEPYNLGQKFKVGIGSVNMRKLAVGQKVLVELQETMYEDMYDAQLIKVLGYATELEYIALANGANPDYSPEALVQAESMPTKVLPEELVGRLDLRKRNIFTIDGDRTKDIDDAIGIRILPNGNFELSVNISHVSHYIKYDTPLFNEAYERGNSYYLLDSVFPQFPPEVSNGICSLNEGVDRLTRSVIIELDEYANIKNYRIVRSVINSKKKMTYNKVNEILEDNLIPNGYEAFVSDLKTMSKLSDIISFKRSENGSLDFENGKPKYTYDIEGHVEDAEPDKQRTAEKLIENFMIVANHVIAEHYYWTDLPFVFRNHGIPDDLKMHETVKLLGMLGYKIEKLASIENPKAVQNMLNQLTNKEEYPIISTLILRSMKKAEYGSENYGHYGLSLDIYTHFTSPIRRLADLLVHMLIDYYEEHPNLELDEIEKLNEFLKKACEQASLKERCADKAEYEAEKLAAVELMEEYIGQTLDVFITEIHPTYITVKTENFIEGVIPISDIGADYLYIPESKSILLNDINKRLFIGTKIPARLTGVSKEYREVFYSFPHLIAKQEKEARIRKRWFSE